MKTALYFFIGIVLLGALFYYYQRDVEIISYMKWKVTGDTVIDEDKIKIIEFTCAENSEYGFYAYAIPRFIDFLESMKKDVVEVSVVTNGEKALRPRGTYYMTPAIEGKVMIVKRIEMINSKDNLFIRCK
jgi:hypothetical protein